ncbi:MAG: amino acid permease [Myxococcota bacterium]|nr:amino acid permease [Myxococcota bacterium]
MIVLGGIIGAGIFINPSVVAQAVHTPVLILAVWATGGLIALAGAFVFAELSALLPRAGGPYAFFQAAIHPLAAFLYGWALLLMIMSGGAAAVAVAFAEYLARLAGLPPQGVAPLAAGTLLLLTGFHALGVKPGAVLIGLVTLLKTVALAALVVGALLLARRSGWSWTPVRPEGMSGPALVSALFAGLVPAMFTYGGWQNLSCVAEEVRDPERTLPRAILLGVGCAVAIYLGANLAYLHVLSAPGLAATRTPAAEVAARLAGEPGARLLSLLIVVSTFGFMNLALLSAPRVYFAMAADGIFFRGLARVSPRFRVPTRAIVLQGTLAAGLALTHTYERLLAYAVFADWVFLSLAAVALIVLRRRGGAPRPFSTPLYPLVPLGFLLFGVGIVGNFFLTAPRHALLGSAILVLGAAVFFLRWHRRPA